MTWLDVDSAAEARYRAIEALSASDEAREPLLEALNDESWRVRRLAVERLAAFEVTQPFVDELISRLGRGHEAGARNAAASVLCQLGSKTVPYVLGLLTHADPDQRKFAADILCELARPEAAEPLVRALADVDANVRIAAAEALGHLGGPIACAALDQLLTSPDAMLRVCALEGLVDSRCAPALPRLVPLLNDPWTRASAFRLLGLVEHPTAVTMICRALASPSTRDSALIALGTRGAPLGAEYEAQLSALLRSSRDVVPWLTHALESDSNERRQGALLASHALIEPTLATAVARAVRPGPVAELALKVLVRLGVRGARLLLSATRTLADLPPASRAVVAEALVRLAEPSLVSPLVTLLKGDDAEFAEVATRALGRTRARAAIAPLLGALDHEVLAPQAFRSMVLLAESWPMEVRQALAPLASEGSKPWVVRGWAEIVREESFEVVQRSLKHSDAQVRAAAAEAAPMLGGAAAGIVQAALLDESPFVRRAATRSLGQLEPRQGHALLARALVDADPTVLALGCAAAADQHATGSVERLRELTQHSEALVVRAALSALSLLGALSDELVVAAARHPDAEVVKRAFDLGADRQLLIAEACAALAHPRWDVRVAAGRLLATSGAPDDLARLYDAVARENDAVAKDSLERLVRSITRT